VSEEPAFFSSAAELRAWLEAHHADADALWVGFHKRHTGRPCPTWSEAVDEALCFGWIDGIRKRVDDDSYKIRFTPRRARSRWSAVNVKRVPELTEAGRMHPAGVRAFAARNPADHPGYSYETRPHALEGEYAMRMDADPVAREFFDAQPPSYRRAAIWWVVSAKREETRLRRLQTLIDDSRAGRRIAQLTPPGRRPR
jgi:uncharacterized protein YdeI (YjbR/CyaY-like superfamily)